MTAVSPKSCLPAYMQAPPRGKLWLAGAGKAAASMAEAYVEAAAVECRGLVVVPYGHGLPNGKLLPGVEVMEAAHPLPDQAALEAGRRIMALAEQAQAGDRLVFLISGGASALLEVPQQGLGLADIQAINRCLLSSGASISEINAVRRKLSRLKGGGITRAAAPADVELLAISDVPGDRLADIGSGPCSPDPVSVAQARNVLGKYACRPSLPVTKLLAELESAVPPGDEVPFGRLSASIIARSRDALAAAAAVASAAGYRPLLLGDDIDAPAEQLACQHAQLVREKRAAGHRVALISGGETTQKLPAHPGRGGRNSSYLLRLLLELGGCPGVLALAADTDGIDGSGEHAGAWFDHRSWRRALDRQLDAEALLSAADSYAFFAGLDQLLITGPTRTNVNDFRVILIDAG